MNAWYSLSLTVLVQVTAITLGAAIAMSVARRRAALCHAIGVVALAFVLASPALALVLPRSIWLGGVPANAASAAPARSPDAAIMDRDEQAELTGETVVAPADMWAEDSSQPPAAIDPAALPVAVAADQHVWLTKIFAVAAGIWAAGVVVLCWRSLSVRRYLRLLASSVEPASIDATVAAEARRALGLGQLPAVGVSDLAPMPLVLGCWRPIVVLPRRAGLLDAGSAARLRDVLIHEFAHIFRRDPWINAAQHVAGIVFWPHPGVHWLSRQIARSREEVCDNFVLGGANSTDYAQTLLELAEQCAGPRFALSLLGMFSRRWSLEERISGILSPDRIKTTRASRKSLAVTALLLAATCALVGGAGAVAQVSGEPSVGPAAEADPVVANAAINTTETKESEFEKLPAGTPDTRVHAWGEPGVFLRPIGLAEVTLAPLQLSATLALDPNRLARVHSQFAGEMMAIGKIRDQRVNLPDKAAERDLRYGDHVTKGQLLAVVWSKELGEKKSDLADALSAKFFSDEKLKRLKALEGGVVPAKQLDEARRQAELDDAAVEKIERTLRSWRVPDDEIDSVGREVEARRQEEVKSPKFGENWAQFNVRAPLAGVILEKNGVIGDFVDPKSDLFQIADLSKLMVVATVAANDISKLKAIPPERRRWSIHALLGAPPIMADFETIGEIVDPRYGTSTVTGTVDNEDGALRPGYSVAATIIDPAVDPTLLSFPVAAVLDEKPGWGLVWVEVDAAKPTFERRRIQYGGPVKPDNRYYGRPVPPVADAGQPHPDADLLRAGAKVIVWGDPQPATPETPAAKPETPPADPKATLPAADSTPLAEAIEKFNIKAADDPIGREQPPLTEDEVVAAILWSALNKTEKVTEKEYAAFRQIAVTRRMPKDSQLEVRSGFRPNDDVEMTAWSVRIRMPRQVKGMEGTTYAFTIRDRSFSSRPLGEEERKVMKDRQRAEASEASLQPQAPAAFQPQPAGVAEVKGSEMLRELRRKRAPILATMAAEHGYGLAPGQSVRRVPLPFPEIRMEYYRVGNPTQAELIPDGPSAMVFRWKDDSLTNWGMTFSASDDAGYSLSGLLDALAGVKAQRIDAAGDLLKTRIPGDWIVRTGASNEQVIEQLAGILSTELSLPIQMKFRDVERPVYVVDGTYRYAGPGEATTTLTDETVTSDMINIFGKQLVPDSGAGGGSGTFAELLDALGSWIGTPLLSDVKMSPTKRFSWAFHARSPFTQQMHDEDHDARLVLANITAQTGLVFREVKRPVKILFVSQAK